MGWWSRGSTAWTGCGGDIGGRAEVYGLEEKAWSTAGQPVVETSEVE